MVPNGAKQVKTGPNGVKWCQLGLIEPKTKAIYKSVQMIFLPRLTLFGIIWHHLALFGPAWPHLALLGHFSIFISRYFKLQIRQGGNSKTSSELLKYDFKTYSSLHQDGFKRTSKTSLKNISQTDSARQSWCTLQDAVQRAE